MIVVLPDLQLDYFPANIQDNTWKNVKKKSSFFLAAPRSKHTPQVSRMVHTRRIRKKSSGKSRTFSLSREGVPPTIPDQQKYNERFSGLTMSKRDNSVQSVEYHWGVNHFVVVKFPQILHLGDSALVELKFVLLEPQGDLLEYVVNNHYYEILVVTIERSNQDGKKVNIAVLHFPWLGKNLFHDADNLLRSENNNFLSGP